MQPVGAISGNRLNSLTGLRFYAALLVVLHHTTRHFTPIPVLRPIFLLGNVGVSFFFILSGFVLTWSTRPDRPVDHFYRNRFARVYPLHLLTWLAAGVLLLVHGTRPSIVTAVTCLLLLQSWTSVQSIYDGMNGPSWSLSCEAFFYAIHPWVAPRVARMHGRLLLRATVCLYLAISLFTVCVHLALRDGASAALLDVNPAYRLWEFVVGIALAVSLRDGWRPSPGVRAAAILTVLLYTLMAATNLAIIHQIGPFGKIPLSALPGDIAALMVAPGFALLIVAAAVRDLRGSRSHLTRPFMIRLGEWSFALYLTHLILIGELERLLPNPGPAWASILLAVGTVLVCIAVSGLVFTYIERPLEAMLRTRHIRGHRHSDTGIDPVGDISREVEAARAGMESTQAVPNPLHVCPAAPSDRLIVPVESRPAPVDQ